MAVLRAAVSLATIALRSLPATRGDCVGGPRPCVLVICRHNLFLDVRRTGGITFNHPDREPWEVEESCSLDVADRGGATLDEVGRAMGLTRERARQLESLVLLKIRLRVARLVS